MCDRRGKIVNRKSKIFTRRVRGIAQCSQVPIFHSLKLSTGYDRIFMLLHSVRAQPGLRDIIKQVVVEAIASTRPAVRASGVKIY